jgi:hypothetical protein
VIKRTLLWLFIILLAIAAYFIIRTLTRTDTDRVRGVVSDLVSSIETDSIPRCMWGLRAGLSSKYVHRGEGTDQPIDKEIALAYVLNLKEDQEYVAFKVDIREMSVSVTGDTARVDITGRITAARKSNPTQRVELMTDGHNKAVIDLKKEDGEWTVVGSRRLPCVLPESPPNTPAQ